MTQTLDNASMESVVTKHLLIEAQTKTSDDTKTGFSGVTQEPPTWMILQSQLVQSENILLFSFLEPVVARGEFVKS